MKSKGILIFVVVLVVSIMLSACAAPTTAVEEKEPILIGGALSLMGIQAPLDEPGLRGAVLAVEELNRTGGILGRPVEFINLDGKSDPVTVGNVTVQLIEQQGAVAMVAPCDFDFGGPASRESQSAGLVGISTCASSPLYGSEALGDKQFTLSMWNTTMGAAAAEYAYNEKGWRSVYVVTDSFIDYTTSLSEYFIKAFQDLSGDVFFEDTYTQGDQDFSAQLARIQALDEMPEFLYISSYMPDMGLIIRTIREAGIDLPIMGGDSYDDPGLFEAVGPEYGNDIIFVTHSWLGEGASPDAEHFLELYEAKHGEPPDTAFVVTGWDTIMVLAEAMEICGSTDGAAMAKVMEETTFDLLTGKLSWSDAESGHAPDKEAFIVELIDAIPHFIGRVLPKSVPAP
ncbi:MAG: ABC transporter substrate-binding protein [Anaerolineaceae bacterium]|nr:ABC transporter substrate-binding protein [Anaerolineaceae bacterium]